MDDKFTQEMQDWLNNPHSLDSEIRKGAEMLLRLNRNKYMYARAIARPQSMLPKIEYELKKHLKYRLDGYTLQQVVALGQETMPAVKALGKTVDNEEYTPKKGIRADHEQLPPAIKAIWETNKRRFIKIKELYNTLLSMEKAMPCDKYEYLKQLHDLYIAYREQMKAYDTYKIGEQAGKYTVESAVKYIKKYAPLAADERDDKKKNKVIAKIQERVDFLIASGEDVPADVVPLLRKLRIVINS